LRCHFHTLPTPFSLCQRVALSNYSDKAENLPTGFCVSRKLGASELPGIGVLEKVIACPVSTFSGTSRTACGDLAAMPSDLLQAGNVDL
jgi:hypothetical protein